MDICHPRKRRSLLPVLFGAFLLGTAPAWAQDRYTAPDAAYQNKDYATAHRLWLNLADEGNASAYFNLGRMHLFGEGTPIDIVEAYKWFKLAEKAGLAQARSGLARVSPLMTQSDVAEAQRRIERWYDQHPRLQR